MTFTGNLSIKVTDLVKPYMLYVKMVVEERPNDRGYNSIFA